MIIHTNQKSKRKTKDSAKKKALRSSWQDLLDKWDVKPDDNKRQNVSKSVSVPSYRRTVFDSAPSLDTGVGVAPKAEIMEYTGDAMIGIGQMHKSNAVPIFKQEDAEDLAKMRR